MQLLPRSIVNKIPKLYETEDIEGPEKVAKVKLFLPGSGWTWYIVEYDGEDSCFGLVDSGLGHGVEFGYFSLNELRELKNPWGLRVERDKFFEPSKIDYIRA